MAEKTNKIIIEVAGKEYEFAKAVEEVKAHEKEALVSEKTARAFLAELSKKMNS